MSANLVTELVRQSQKPPGSKVADLIKRYPVPAAGIGVLGVSLSGLGAYHAFKKNYKDAKRDAILADLALAEKTSQYAYPPPQRTNRPAFGKLDGIAAAGAGGAALGAGGMLLQSNRASLPEGGRGSILDSAKDLVSRTKDAYTTGAKPPGVTIVSADGKMLHGKPSGVLAGLKNVGSRGWQRVLRTPGIKAGGLYGAAAGVGLAGLGSLLG